jgi:SAM domain (Sterile alpha motif)/Adenylate and Guanylate cyclase catalytic domain
MLQGEARAASWTVVVWLRSLGLGKYEAAFRENDIDETVLPNLTAEDLKELGVASLGHRRKLLDAIPALRTYASAQAPSPMVAPVRPIAATTTHAPVAEAVGERRHITVMFCDLVGSTSISAGLDAEKWRDLVGAYLDAASAAVREMGGNVAKKLGDGLMALFGYPVAQENDSERAVRAALSIQRALAELNRNTSSRFEEQKNAPARSQHARGCVVGATRFGSVENYLFRRGRPRCHRPQRTHAVRLTPARYSA